MSLSKEQKKLQQEAVLLIEEIKALNKSLYFHQRHKSKDLLIEKGLCLKFQDFIHKAFNLNVSDGTLSFDQIHENFLQMCLINGVEFSNPFLVVFYENKSLEIVNLFNKYYTNPF